MAAAIRTAIRTYLGSDLPTWVSRAQITVHGLVIRIFESGLRTIKPDRTNHKVYVNKLAPRR